jgi:beta-galactosidase/beta-glucuronidase
MAYPHVIRLRGGWLMQPIERFAESRGAATPGFQQQVVQRVEVPHDWRRSLGVDFQGKVRYTRRFNTPTNLGANERVWLCCEGASEWAEVWLNKARLPVIGGPDRFVECDITRLLFPHNELIVEVASRQTAHPSGLTGEVRLEIREAE